MDVILFITLTVTGEVIGIFLRIPAGALIGALLLVGTCKSMGVVSFHDIPHFIRWAGQAGLGLTIGLMFTKEVIKMPKKMILAFLIVGLASIVSAFSYGFLISKSIDLPLVSAVISVIPGGMAEMLALADSESAEMQAVVTFHLLRFVLLMISAPLLLNMIIKKMNQKEVANK